jgi:hypothetical protein
MCGVIFRRQGTWSRFHGESDGADQVRPPRIRSDLAGCASSRNFRARAMGQGGDASEVLSRKVYDPQGTCASERANHR